MPIKTIQYQKANILVNIYVKQIGLGRSAVKGYFNQCNICIPGLDRDWADHPCVMAPTLPNCRL